MTASPPRAPAAKPRRGKCECCGKITVLGTCDMLGGGAYRHCKSCCQGDPYADKSWRALPAAKAKERGQ